MLNYFKTN